MSATHGVMRHEAVPAGRLLPGVERVFETGAMDGTGLASGEDWGGRWSAAPGGDEAHRRDSLNSNGSDEDWEVVQKRDSLAMPEPSEIAAGRSTSGVGLSGNVLARAADWMQWGLDGAVKGVEKTCDGLKGVW